MLALMRRRGFAIGLLLLAGCEETPSQDQSIDRPTFEDDEEEEPIDDRPVVRTATPPPPIFGGTLHVSTESRLALAAEPDRDRVRLIDLDEQTLAGEIVFDDGDLPWRMTEAPGAIAWVSLRGGGAIAAIDLAEQVVIHRVEVCPNPRGLAYDATEHAIVTACAGGDVVFVDADTGDELQRSRHPSDLRDVLITGETIRVTRFRSTEILTIRGDDPDLVPPSPTRRNNLANDDETVEPRVAWKTIPRPGGGLVMLHQLATTRALELFDNNRVPVYYQNAGCDGVSNVSVGWTRNGEMVGAGAIDAPALSVDIAVSPFGNRYAIAGASVSTELGSGIVFGELLEREKDDDGGGCVPTSSVALEGTVTSVAYDDVTLLVQTREPSAVTFVTSAGGTYGRVELPGDSVTDTGHDLFHLDPGTGVTCATCHPEGGTDGHVWNFEFGLRATQPLDVDLAQTAPYHWAGEHEDMAALIDDTHHLRMRAPILTDERRQVFEEWLVAIPSPAPQRIIEDEATTRGKAVFADAGCDRCHDGAMPKTLGNVDLQGTFIQIPHLAGLATRPIFMHDGRAHDLRSAAMDMLARTAPDVELADAELDDLTAYLATL